MGSESLTSFSAFLLIVTSVVAPETAPEEWNKRYKDLIYNDQSDREDDEQSQALEAESPPDKHKAAGTQT